MKTIEKFNHNGNSIIVSAYDDKEDIKIKIFCSVINEKEYLQMDIPLTSINKISKNYLETCAVKLIAAMQWSDVELQNLYA